MAAKSGPESASMTPCAASQPTACAARPVVAKAWLTTNRPMKSTSSSQSMKPITCEEWKRRDSSSRPAATSAATSRGQGVNRKMASSAAATQRPLMVCQRSKGGSLSALVRVVAGSTGVPRCSQASQSQSATRESAAGGRAVSA